MIAPPAIRQYTPVNHLDLFHLDISITLHARCMFIAEANRVVRGRTTTHQVTHRLRGIPPTLDLEVVQNLVDVGELGFGQSDVGGLDVLLDAVDVGRARDGDVLPSARSAQISSGYTKYGRSDAVPAVKHTAGVVEMWSYLVKGSESYQATPQTYIRAQPHHPSQRQLTGADSLGLRELIELIDQLQVIVERLALESRYESLERTLWDILGRFPFTGDEAPAEG